MIQRPTDAVRNHLEKAARNISRGISADLVIAVETSNLTHYAVSVRMNRAVLSIDLSQVVRDALKDTP